jgi:hypothetical protein
MKIFGREPAAWVGLIEAVLAMLMAVRVIAISSEQEGAILAVVVAGFGLYTAWVTRDTLLGVAVGFVKAILALLIGFGLDLQPDQTAAVIAFTVAALSLYQRTQTSPLARPTFAEPPVGMAV